MCVCKINRHASLIYCVYIYIYISIQYTHEYVNYTILCQGLYTATDNTRGIFYLFTFFYRRQGLKLYATLSYGIYVYIIHRKQTVCLFVCFLPNSTFFNIVLFNARRPFRCSTTAILVLCILSFSVRHIIYVTGNMGSRDVLFR